MEKIGYDVLCPDNLSGSDGEQARVCVLWHRGNVNEVVVERVEIGGMILRFESACSTEITKREPERHGKLPSFNDRHPELSSARSEEYD